MEYPNELSYCIQCKDAISGNTGTFAYRADAPKFTALSPVFPSLVEFYQWAKELGYQSKPNSYQNVMYRAETR